MIVTQYFATPGHTLFLLQK